MPEEYASPGVPNDALMRVRDIEERQRLLKERVILIGENVIADREDTLEQIQLLKKIVMEMKEEQIRMKEFLQRLALQSAELARKEELMIVQRQLNMLTPSMEASR